MSRNTKFLKYDNNYDKNYDNMNDNFEYDFNNTDNTSNSFETKFKLSSDIYNNNKNASQTNINFNNSMPLHIINTKLTNLDKKINGLYLLLKII